MTQLITISEFRNNLSYYLAQAMKGNNVLIRDGKKRQPIAQLTQATSFDKNRYEKVLRKVAGTFTAQNHPEWKTKQDIINWLTKSRLSAERSF